MPASTRLRSRTRLRIGVAVNLLVAALHVLDLGALLRPDLQRWHGSYFSDVAIPFAFYYLLCFIDDRVSALRPAAAKALAVFLGAATAELCQGVGIPLLGRTFDPWDLAMYAAGVSAAAVVDVGLLARRVRGWSLTAPPSGTP